MLKNKIWLFQVPFVALFTFCYVVTEHGLQGDLKGRFLQDQLYPSLQRVMAAFSDAKFRVRGFTKPKNKIVVVAIDNAAVDTVGRWPWHRDVQGELIDKAFEAGAKVVGMDIVYSEPDIRVSPELRAYLAKQGKAADIESFETDHIMTNVVRKYGDRLVLGSASQAQCNPLKAFKSRVGDKVDFDADECPVTLDGVEVASGYPKNYDKFALPVALPSTFDPWLTPILTDLSLLANLDEYNDFAQHSAFFDTVPDQDHVIRRAQLVLLYRGKVYPSLPFEMARVGMGEQIDLQVDANHGIQRLAFKNAGREIPVTRRGSMKINFRGPGETYPYISAAELLAPQALKERGIASEPKKDLLKDAYALIGVTAVGLFDMRAFPFDQNVAGVEGHATILDNLLSGDALTQSVQGHSQWILILMIVGALLFAFSVEKLESIPAMILFVLVMSGVGIADFKVMFERNIDLNTSFLYIELFTIFFVIFAVKYVIEERSKKFVRSAFAKYVAPAVVDSILKDPEKLTVGGEKKDLTIMFSDIRSFTTFSEKMDAKALAHFLNDYLGIMTKIVFANEGTLDKYIGDAIMAFWGAPLDQPMHSLNACKAAISMMQALHQNKERWLKEFNVDVNIGVGINSGPVNVGNMGSTDNFAYTVIGDHVNLSSRLEGLTKEYGVSILTTRYTFDEIAKAGGELPPHRVLDNTKVKGKKTAVELIQVLDRSVAKEGLETFVAARKLYLEQRWDAAIAKFREANSYLAQSAEKPDGPCELFIGRCEEFKKNPPEKDWDGSWKMDHK